MPEEHAGDDLADELNADPGDYEADLGNSDEHVLSHSRSLVKLFYRFVISNIMIDSSVQ